MIKIHDTLITDMSTESEAAFKSDMQSGVRLTMVATSYALTNNGEALVVYHLEGKDGLPYIAIHQIASIELMIADYMKAKAKLNFQRAARPR